MTRDIDVSLLRSFLAVVDTGGVTAAAKLLGRTQAAVSQQIKRLEDVLETPLFDRQHKRVSLASGGELLLAQARRIVAMNDEVYGMMTTPSFNGEVRLGIPCDIVPTYAPPILRRFAQAWPKVRVQLISANTVALLGMLEDGDLDVTLTTEIEGGKMAGETLRRDKLVWCAATDGDVHLSETLPLAIGSVDCSFRPAVLTALREAGRDWRFVFEVNNQEAQTATVAAGLAICALLQDSVPAELRILGASSGLPALPSCGINLYLPKGQPSELGAELARQIRLEFEMRFGTPAVRPGAAGSRTGTQAKGDLVRDPSTKVAA
ncbi:MAG: LysR substrate-binding domain-containing protein [Pseudomonadota bacterium]